MTFLVELHLGDVSRSSWWLNLNFFLQKQKWINTIGISTEKLRWLLVLISFSTFHVELHLDVFHGVLLVVWFDFDIVWRISEKIATQLKLKSQDPKKSTIFLTFSDKFCVARTFLVELHLDDVLDVLLVVGLKFHFTHNYNTINTINKKMHWLGWLFNKWLRYLTCFVLVERRKIEEEKRITEVSKSSIWKHKKSVS